MKVAESGGDRKAEVHLYVAGKVEPLAEYGEYVDPADGAIGCFVPVDAGDRIKISGRFDGPTLTLAYDVLVDGICRKYHTYTSKAVAMQRNKKLDAEQVLFKANGQVLETELVVNPTPPDLKIHQQGSANLGTIEMRLSVLRRFGEEHALRDVAIFDDVSNEGHNFGKVINYSKIPPDFYITYDKNIAPLEPPASARQKKRMGQKRPGAETWAIFRFHYRQEKSILDQKMKMSYNSEIPKSKQPEAHKLELPPIPPLIIGTKPSEPGDLDNSSTRQSTPAPKTPASFTSDVADEKKPKKTAGKSLAESKLQATTIDSEVTHLSPKMPSSPNAKDMERLSRAFGTSPPDPTCDTLISVQEGTSDTKTNGAEKDPGENKVLRYSKGNKEKDMAKSIATKGKSTVQIEQPQASTVAGLSKVKSSKPATDSCETTATRDREYKKEPATTKVTSSEVKNAAPKKVSAIPAKRPSDPTPPHTPENKKAKKLSDPVITDVPAPDTTPFAFDLGTLSPSPASASSQTRMTQKVTAARLRLQISQARREQIAKEQKEIDERLTPYLKQIEEEADAINKQAQEEERENEQNEKQLQESLDMLKQFQQAQLE